MKKKAAIFLKITLAIAGLILMIVFTVGVFRSKIEGTPLAERIQPVPENAIPAVVREDIVTTPIRLSGTLASERNVNISARIQAHVSRIYVSAGQSVTTNAVLLSLDDREIQEQLAAAEAAVHQTQSEHQRQQSLLASGSGLRQAAEAAEAAFRAAEANAEKLRVMLSYTSIVSPFNGVVTERIVEEGDLASPGQLLMSIYDATRMRLEVPVPIRLVERFPAGHALAVQLEHPDITVTGTVAELVSAIDPRTRTQTAKLLLAPAGTATLLPGGYGHVVVQGNPRTAILAPYDAVQRTGQLEFVRLAQKDGMIRRMVKTGPRFGADIEILSGLNAGDQVFILSL